MFQPDKINKLCFVELLQHFIPFLAKYLIGLQEFDMADGIFLFARIQYFMWMWLISLNKPFIKEKHNVIWALTNNDLKWI